MDVWSKGFLHQRQLDVLSSATVSPLRNKVGTATFAVPSDHPANASLQADGARVTCTYLGVQEFSGPVRKLAPELQVNGTTTYTAEDDVRIVQNTLGWVRPVASGSSQGQVQAQSLSDDGQAVSTVAHTAGTDAGYGAYVFDSTTTAAESAIKELVFRNLVQRIGRPVSVLNDQARGGNAFAAGKLPVVRMVPLLDVLQDLLEWSGLTLLVRQSTTAGVGFTLDVRPSRVFGPKLTLDSGIITDGIGQVAKPTATRAVVGGPGDDTARAWYSVVDAAAEAQHGDVIEVLKDASGVSPKWDSSITAAYQVAKYFHLQPANGTAAINAFLAALAAAGQEALTDGAARSGLSMTLAEAGVFRYGGANGIRLGDTLQVQASAGQPASGTTPAMAPVLLTGKVSGATITLDESGGVKAVPQVGERTDDPDAQLAQAIAGLQTALRRSAARK